MDREEFNKCMKPWMTGTGKTKDERKTSFCIGAKLCSGKSKTEEDAAQVCSLPRLPKWAKTGSPKEKESLSCDEIASRIIGNLDTISLKVRAGEADEVKGVAAQVLQDTIKCPPGEGIAPLVQEAMDDVNDLAKRYYLKGESNSLERKINLIRAAMGGA